MLLAPDPSLLCQTDDLVTLRAEALLADYGQLIGIPDLTLSEHGMCQITVDNRYQMTLLVKREDAIHIIGFLGKYPEPEPDKLAVKLLAMNFTIAIHGLSVCLEQESRCLSLVGVLQLDGLDAKGLRTKVERMVNCLEALTKLFADNEIVLIV